MSNIANQLITTWWQAKKDRVKAKKAYKASRYADQNTRDNLYILYLKAATKQAVATRALIQRAKDLEVLG